MTSPRTTRSPEGGPARGAARFATTSADGPPPDRFAGVVSALLLLLIVVGVPVGMVLLDAVPGLPTSLPTREQLTATIGPEQLLGVLVWVVWIAWLQFTVCVLVEVRSAVAGVGLPARVPLAGPSQRLARTLVASVLLLVTAAGPATALQQGPGVPEPAATPVASVSVAAQEVAPEAPAPTAEAPQVAPGADVTYRLGDLVLSPEEGAELAGKRVYVVQPPEGRYHDNLWDIAERELGDGRRYKEVFELNQGRTQPDGQELSLARLIQPHWLLVMPEDATGIQRVEAVAPEPAAPAPTPGTTATTPAGDTVDAPTEAADAPVAEVAAATVADRFPGLAGAGLLAAGLLAGIEVLRRRRRTPEPSAEAVELEVALRVGATPDRAERLEVALRGLAAAHEVARRPLPPVYAVRVDDAGVELLLSPPSTEPPEPWQVRDDGARWWRPADATDPVTRRRGSSPYPGLVSVGRDDEGADVLVDLEAAQGPVAVTGPVDVARQVVTALAAELATNAWSGPVAVHGSALPETLSALGERYRPVADPAGLLRGWRESADDAGDVLTGRSVGAGGRWTGEYLLHGEPVDDALAGALAWSGRAPWGAVVVGEVAAARWRWEVDDEGRLTLPALGLAVTANRLRGADAAAVAELVRPPLVEEDGPDGSDPEHAERPSVPLPARPVLPEDLAAAPVAVRVLGAPSVSAPGPVEPERVALATELVVHLALHPDGVHPAVLAGDLWPHGVTREVRDATVDRARTWLGQDASGRPRLQERPDGRLVLGPDVVLDWAVLLTLLQRSRTAPDTGRELDDLQAGLDLARGALLADRPRGRYAWLVRARLERLSRDLVVDAAHRAAVLLAREPDPGGSERSARAGLAVAPLSELLWRDVLRATAASRGAAGVHEVAAELEDALHRAGVPAMSSPTAALVEELAPRGGTDEHAVPTGA